MLPFVNGCQGVNWAHFTAGLRSAGYQGALSYETHNAFNAVPDALLDATLKYAVQIGRHLVQEIGVDAVI
jgi:sugar phosphate isomerase/epimerase